MPPESGRRAQARLVGADAPRRHHAAHGRDRRGLAGGAVPRRAVRAARAVGPRRAGARHRAVVVVRPRRAGGGDRGRGAARASRRSACRTSRPPTSRPSRWAVSRIALVGAGRGPLGRRACSPRRAATGSTPTRSCSPPARPTSAAGFSGGLGVGGSLSKTAAAYRTGSRSQITGHRRGDARAAGARARGAGALVAAAHGALGRRHPGGVGADGRRGAAPVRRHPSQRPHQRARRDGRGRGARAALRPARRGRPGGARPRLPVEPRRPRRHGQGAGGEGGVGQRVAASRTAHDRRRARAAPRRAAVLGQRHRGAGAGARRGRRAPRHARAAARPRGDQPARHHEHRRARPAARRGSPTAASSSISCACSTAPAGCSTPRGSWSGSATTTCGTASARACERPRTCTASAGPATPDGYALPDPDAADDEVVTDERIAVDHPHPDDGGDPLRPRRCRDPRPVPRRPRARRRRRRPGRRLATPARSRPRDVC